MPIKDAFDDILTSEISIWKKGGSGLVDNYGIESQVYTLLAANVPCRIDEMQGKELDTGVAFGEQTYQFYLRPIKVDNPPVPINIHHWIQINVKHGEFIADTDPNGIFFDVKNIKNLFNHHLEISTMLLEP